MVGEMRDLDTLEIGIRSALTGHLVLSTIHTNDSVSTVTRMVNMGTEPYLIASTLITAVAQRLVRSICPHCKEEYDLPDPVRARMQDILEQDIPKTALARRRLRHTAPGPAIAGAPPSSSISTSTTRRKR